MYLADPQRSLALSLSLALPTPVAAPALPAPAGESRMLRRLRRTVRRRVRLDVAAIGAGTVVASDGAQVVRVDTVSPRDPRVIAWTADRPLALVVLHDGCGARVVGPGGSSGRIELPSGIGRRAFLAFCYDTEAEAAVA